MATEKILNTRIINKHALLSDWNSSELILKDGEIALAKVTLTEQHTDGKISEVPAYLVKVGTGDKNFKETAWAYAKAADVHAWAKAATKPTYTADEIDGLTEFIEGISDIDTDLDTRYTFELVEGKLVVKSKLYSKGESAGEAVQEAEIDFITPDELNAILLGYVKSVSGKDAIKSTGGQNPEISLALDNSGNVQFTQSADGLKGNVDLSNFVQKDGDKVLSDNNYTDDEKTKLAGITAGATKVEASSTNGNIKINGTETTVYTHPATHTSSEISDFNTAVAAVKVTNATNADSATNATNAANAAKLEGKTTAEITAEIKEAFTGTIADGNTGFVTGDAVYDVKATADDAKNKIDTFLASVTPDGADNIIDTLQEINDYVGEHGEAFATLSGKVTNIENGTTTVPKAANADTVDGLHAQDLKDYADTASSNAVSAFATAIDQRKYANEDYVNSYVNNAIQALDEDFSGDTNKTLVSLSQVDGKIAATFQDIAITKSQITDFDETDYATKEQGAKADTAIQGIFTDTDGGPGRYHYVKDILTVKDNRIADGEKMWILQEAVENGVQYASNGLEIVTKTVEPGTYRKEVKIDTATKTKIDNAVQSSEVAVYTQAGFGGSPNTIVRRDAEGNIYSTPLKTTDPTIVDYTKLEDYENRVITGGDIKTILENYKENVVAIKDHSISAHQTKACQDYRGEDAEVWVFDCGGAN